MGKSPHFNVLADKMEKFVTSSNLDQLFLDDNNLRAQHGEKILKAICQVKSLSVLSLARNFLGTASKDGQAPIVVLTDLLIKSTFIENLDLGYNGIQGRSVYCLSEGIILNKSLKYLSLEGNPLGKVGLSLLMKAKTKNIAANFALNIKMAEGESDSAVDFKISNFNPEKPEGPQSLDLTKIYDQLVLQKLLTIA